MLSLQQTKALYTTINMIHIPIILILITISIKLKFIAILVTACVVVWPGFLATDPEVWVLFQVLLSLVSTVEQLLGRKISGSGLESREHSRKDPSRWPRGIL
jgi:hypothetical protein